VPKPNAQIIVRLESLPFGGFLKYSSYSFVDGAICLQCVCVCADVSRQDAANCLGLVVVLQPVLLLFSLFVQQWPGGAL